MLPNRVRLAPNGTNLGLSQISFSTFLVEDRAASGLSDFGVQKGNRKQIYVDYNRVGILRGGLFLSCSNVSLVEQVKLVVFFRGC